MIRPRLVPVGLALVVVYAFAVPASADSVLAKKDRYLAGKLKAAPADAEAVKRWQRQLRKRIGKAPAKLINIYNGHTDEVLAVRASRKAKLDLPADMVNQFLRCHFTNQPAKFDTDTFATMVKAARHFRSKRVIIISGFRSPKYNLTLIKKGREVSRRSQHVKGKAIDFALPGVSVKRLHSWCVNQRLGGVGFYPHSGFVHIDTGRVRYWSGR